MCACHTQSIILFYRRHAEASTFCCFCQIVNEYRYTHTARRTDGGWAGNTAIDFPVQQLNSQECAVPPVLVLPRNSLPSVH